MLTPDVIRRQQAVLLAVYGQHRIHGEFMAELANRCSHLDAFVFESAIDCHINDTREEGGQIIGNWPPTPAQVLAHAAILRQEQRENEAKRARDAEAAQVEAWEAQAEEDRYQEIPLPEGLSKNFWIEHLQRRAKAGTQGEALITLTPDQKAVRVRVNRQVVYRCTTCYDTGWVNFWFDPAQRRRVWLPLEWLELPEAMQVNLGQQRCLCDLCPKGQDLHDRYYIALYGGVVGGTAYQPTLTSLKKIRALAQQRQATEEATIGV